MLAAHNFPAHRTIRDFRAQHLGEFTELFTQVVRLAREMGLVKLGTIAVDGTKIKANASRDKAMSYARMQSTEADLKAQIAALLQKAAHTDEAEKNEPDLDIPVELKRRQARLAAIEAAKARLEERQSQNDMARGRSAGDGRKPLDKDGKPKDAVQTHTGAQPAQVLADAGYRSEAVMARLAQAYPDTELVIALGREGKARTAPKDAKRYPHTVAMAAKFQTEQGQKDYRKRKWLAEPPNGWIKNVLGLRQFSMRGGLEKAKAEFKLVCMALNLRRMGAMQAR